MPLVKLAPPLATVIAVDEVVLTAAVPVPVGAWVLNTNCHSQPEQTYRTPPPLMLMKNRATLLHLGHGA
jgi:hypothetical protein